MVRPILTMVNDDGEEVHRKRVREVLAGLFASTDDEKKALLETREILSGGHTKFVNEVSWAISKLYWAGLLERPKRGFYQITNMGKSLLKSEADVWGAACEMAKVRGQARKQAKTEKEVATEDDTVEPQEPKKDNSEEQLALLYGELNDRLAAELLERVRTIPPAAFEQLVVNLLEQMGYGRGKPTREKNDEGIDGIISQDALGLEKVYIQAKRWGNNSVHAPQIDSFAGSLDGKGASKGVFITSSTFSKGAKERALSISQGTKLIRLIDGEELVHLMMRYGVGVITKDRYDVRQIDENFFVEGSDPVVPLSWQPTQMLLSPGDLFSR